MASRNAYVERSVGAFEAKTNLSRYVADAQKGIVTVVTVRGRPAAKIVPADAELVPRAVDWEVLLEGARQLRERSKPGPETMAELIDAGRR